MAHKRTSSKIARTECASMVFIQLNVREEFVSIAVFVLETDFESIDASGEPGKSKELRRHR